MTIAVCAGDVEFLEAELDGHEVLQGRRRRKCEAA